MLVLIDLEATCARYKEYGFVSEIIEIGAIKFDPKKKEIIDRYQTFIRPKINPILSDFCRELTTITQEQVESAHYFDTEYNRFIKWYGNKDKNLFCSWGYYDKRMIEQACEREGIGSRLGGDHWNVKKFYQEITGQTSSGVGLSKAVRQCGLSFVGTPHRAISDAENIAEILKVVLK